MKIFSQLTRIYKISRVLFSFVMILLVVAGCSRVDQTVDSQSSTPPPSANGLILIAETDSLSVWATEADGGTAQDIVTTLQEHAGQVCADLQTLCEFPVVIEVYPDQASFDQHAMNQEMRGFFAISGDGHKIQMVSPANPAPNNISYPDGVLVAVHEFTHLALDEIDPKMPTWLDEGAAIYVGPHAPYTTVCQIAFPFEMIPSFQQLEDSYNSVSAPDLFSYTAVDFIVREYGMDKLNMLLRSSEDMEAVLGVSQTEFEDQWHRFIRAQYHDDRAQPKQRGILVG